MYTSVRSIIRRGNPLYFIGQFGWRTSRRYLVNCRFYHSENGVYGYKPRFQKLYEVEKNYLEVRSKNSNFYRLVSAYREHAHKQANINPVSMNKPKKLSELLPERYGLSLTDKVNFKGILYNVKNEEGTVLEGVQFLDKIYSNYIGFEFNHLETEEEREWFAETAEKTLINSVSEQTKKSIAKEMLKSQAFDNFLAVKFVSLKRYGGEGAESMMAFFYEFFRLSVLDGLEQIVIALPHRGRLNLLTGMLKFPPEKLFRKLRGLSEFPENAESVTGDVISHLTASVDLEIQDGQKIHVTVLRNPSHLEAVNPVSMGKTRGIMQVIKDGAYNENDRGAEWSDKVLNIQIHGDAAYAGQGINQECLTLSKAPHFEIGGTVHLIVNNQIGFTTPPSRGRSSRYCTDIAKSIDVPIIHVNGDHPEMVVRATRIAVQYQRKFRKDVFVDLNCYRRWGHNELDDPTFTNPVIYQIINNRKSVPDLYLRELAELNILDQAEGNRIVEAHLRKLTEALQKVDSYVPQPSYFSGRWTGFARAKCDEITYWDTGVEIDLLKFVGNKSIHFPPELEIHPQLLKNHINNRAKKLGIGERLDWSTAEALAFGTLLYQGYNIRLSGQDIGRGTFSHRHAMLIDQTSGAIHIPLNSMMDDQTGKIELANSILSEEAVLGYEYGMSITLPNTLTVWEAQFGDFFNGAQIIIDTFITSGEAKWMLSSGLVMLLPHGYDGAGPEHSSCRLERFLQLTDSQENQIDTDDVNMEIVNPTKPAQYFHVLRKQMVRNFRKPLIIVAPKILLRHPSATSSFKDMEPGTSFQNIIGDEKVDPSNVDKVLLVSGKHYYILAEQREKIGAFNVAIIRLERLCPFPVNEILGEIEKYKKNKVFIWCQEEPRNMGAWSFIKPRFENLCGQQLKYCGRKSTAAPAVGEGRIHEREVQEIVVTPFIMK